MYNTFANQGLPPRVSPYLQAFTLPPPYQTNRNLPRFDQATAPMMKRGGRAKSKEMTTVHMNPHEISIMEHIQGHAPYNRSGIKEFHHLEELLKNPHILRNSHRHAQHHEDGGIAHEDMEHLSQGGRFGDSTLASIGPNTQHFFNQLAGHQTMNPYTGHPEYWGLSSVLSGIGKTIGAFGKNFIKQAAPHAKDIARQVLPSVLPAAQDYLGNKFGGIGKTVGQYAGNAATNALGPQEGVVNPHAQTIGNAINKGIGSYRQGLSQEGVTPRQAFGQAVGQGIQSAGSQLGGGMGDALEGMGKSMGKGHGLGESLRTGAQTGFNTMGGVKGLKDMGSKVYQGFGTGGFGGAQKSAMEQLNDYRARMLPQMQNPVNQAV